MQVVKQEGWLSDELKEKIRKVFEPRYKEKLSDEMILQISNNLTLYMETILRLRSRMLDITEAKEK